MTNRFKLVSEVSLVLIRDGKVCLLRRSNTGYEDGKYCFIAGHKDEGESALQSIIREAAEESGLLLKPQQLRLAHVMHRNESDERIAFFFVANDWEGEPANREPHKHDEMGWFPLDALPDVIPYMRSALQKIQEEEVYSEFGWD
jgi:8-oxo-dGTP diphosphatase